MNFSKLHIKNGLNCPAEFEKFKESRKSTTTPELLGDLSLLYFDADKKEIKKKIESIDDIYIYEKQLLQVVDFYEKPEVGKMAG